MGQHDVMPLASTVTVQHAVPGDPGLQRSDISRHDTSPAGWPWSTTDPDVLLCSPLRRARETAGPTAVAPGLARGLRTTGSASG